MRLVWLGGAILFFGGMASRPATKSEETVLLIGGSTDGYLAPCGCTKPMTGGIRRRVSALKALSRGGKAVIVENGGLVSGIGRQDELKAETMAESLKAAGVTAINLTRSEAALGAPMVNAIQRLSGSAFLSGSVTNAREPISARKQTGPFLIGAASTQADEIATALEGKPIDLDTVVTSLLEEGKRSSKATILLLDGSRAEAEKTARDHPGLGLIVFRSSGDPADAPTRIGNTLLVSPGERGKHIIRLAYGGQFRGYSVVKLGPDVTDDPTAARAYDRYLSRVAGQKLLERLPRAPGPQFAGTKACSACHTGAYDVWKTTSHSHALLTLEQDKHDRDPDCVGCHVVGLPFETGFMDRTKTPDLADVGCESCHGAGGAHASNPSTKMGPAGKASCMPCHKAENSPKFDFETYWAKVIHK